MCKRFSLGVWLSGVLMVSFLGTGGLLAADESSTGSGEESIELSEVPPNVLKAGQQAAPGVEFSSAEREVEDGRVIYSLEGALDGEEVEVELDAEGNVLEIERHANDDSDEDQADDEDDEDGEEDDDEPNGGPSI